MEYTGNVLINTRNIKPIEEILESNNPPKGTDLNKLLSFLSIYSLSDGLLYDGTIPEKFLSPAIKTLGNLGIEQNAKPLKTLIDDEFEEIVSESLNQCSEIIIEAIDNYKDWKPVSEIDTNNFFSTIDKLKNENISSIKREIAYTAYNSNFLGGKLLIGLTSQINYSVFNHLVSLKLNNIQKAKVVSAMIGTFRTFLLSNTATKNNALYNTNPEFVKLLENKNIKTWDILMNEFNSPHNLCQKVQDERLNWRWKFPLVGAAILIDAADSSNNIYPNELFAFSKKSESCKQISSIQKELINRYTKAVSPEDIIEEMEDFWRNLIKQKSSENYTKIFKSGITYSIAPTVVGGAAELASNIVFSPDLIPTWVVGSSVGLLFLLYKCYNKKVNYLNAISNLSSYNNEVEILLESSLRKIWRKK